MTTQNTKLSTTARSLWVYTFGVSCCNLELLAVAGPRYDWERFGCKVVTDPGSADVLIVAGPVVESMREELRLAYQKMRDPKYVISIGSCANSGGMFAENNYAVIPGVESLVPVDIFVPGCPPRPEAILHAVLSLQKKISQLVQA